MNREEKMMIRWNAISAPILALGLMAGATACGGSEPTTDPDASVDPTPGDAGEDGTTTLVEVEPVEPGDECAAGGFRVVTGVDADGDGTLSAEEASAGSALVECDAEGEPACSGAVSIESVDSTASGFAVGTAATVTITIAPADQAADARVLLLGGDFDIAASDEPGDFAVTPRISGGPFTLTAVVANRCSVDDADFVIDEVTPAAQ